MPAQLALARGLAERGHDARVLTEDCLAADVPAAGCHFEPFVEGPLTAEALSEEYVRRGIFPEKYASDGNHVAVAVVHGVSFFVSWNFRHLVKVKTRREINLVNSLMGYGQIEIVAPPEM